ncbi:unnamed protein product [Cladocopium goreaui]|uniref:R3H domain-containing protein n=1 Tax=Cladocopium goreaui TaxID=2562237 RepID=A0A9P1BQY6_9DINO|nr:unnamed protein product [Cladocopium goreaui]
MGPKESNEEAMLRLMAKGKGGGKGGKGGKGKGGKGGKGDRKGGPPSSDELPETRRVELCAELDEFVASSKTQLQMSSSITGLERKFLHEQAELRNLTTQSFGQGRERYICIFKEVAVAPVLSEFAATEGGSSGAVSYSAVFLDEESQQKIIDFCRRTVPGGIPHRWKMYCDHMTICVGALSNPKTEDFRSVAGNVQQQISRYQEGQNFELKVVSFGHNEDAIAVGVLGCVSCNRNPHVTVSTAPHAAPSTSNLIKKWTMLSSNDQFTVTGQLWQQGGKQRKQRGAAAGSAEAAEANLADATATGGATSSFVSHHWHQKKFKLGMVKAATGVTCPDGQWFGLGSKKKYYYDGFEPLPDGLRDNVALMLEYSKDDATTFVFEEVGKTKGGDLVNPRTLQGGVIVEASVPVYSFHTDQESPSWVGELDEGPGPEYYVRFPGPTYSKFAFLPLEPDSRRPTSSGRPPPGLNPGDCLYGMYHMDKTEDSEYFHFWMGGDWCVYLIENQLCRASDECYPPFRFKVALLGEHVRVIQVEILRCGEASVAVTCQNVSGEVVAELKLAENATLGSLRKQIDEVGNTVSHTYIVIHS